MPVPTAQLSSRYHIERVSFISLCCDSSITDLIMSRNLQTPENGLLHNYSLRAYSAQLSLRLLTRKWYIFSKIGKLLFWFLILGVFFFLKTTFFFLWNQPLNREILLWDATRNSNAATSTSTSSVATDDFTNRRLLPACGTYWPQQGHLHPFGFNQRWIKINSWEV